MSKLSSIQKVRIRHEIEDMRLEAIGLYRGADAWRQTHYPSVGEDFRARADRLHQRAQDLEDALDEDERGES